MITRLIARNFRNLRALDWRPRPGWNVLVGPNGAGKTSVLEALYAVATTRSFRTARLVRCVEHGAEGFRVEAEAEDDARVRLSIAWSDAGLDRRRNDSSVDLAEHLAALPVVLWWLGSLDAVGGGPKERRRLLDQGLVAMSPQALAAAGRFRRALAQKRRLLVESRASGPLLGSWNELLAAEASVLVRARADYVERLSHALGQILEEDGNEPGAVALRYRPSLPDALKGPQAAHRALQGWRRREQEAHRALVGPQRDDLEISWRGARAAETASGGERKWITVALAAARGRVLEAAGKRPIYLLDDLDAELDADRLERCLRLFPRHAQKLVTTTRGERFEAVAGGVFWELGNGRVRGLESGA